jgi:hypothetical protein
VVERSSRWIAGIAYKQLKKTGDGVAVDPVETPPRKRKERNRSPGGLLPTTLLTGP